MLTNLHAIIFTNQKSYNLGELTDFRSMSSVPYGGRYRLIDFMLSSCANAGVSNVGLVLQENYQSLLDHVESGKDWDLARKKGGLRLLPPFSQKAGARDPRGRMESLINLGNYVHEIKQDYVLLADGDLVANIDLEKVMAAHIESGADVTPIVTTNYHGQPLCTNYFVPQEDGTMDVLHNPDDAQGYEALNVYIMSKAFLSDAVKYCKSRNLYSLVNHVLLPRRKDIKIVPYVFEGYAARFTSVSDYFKDSMEILQKEVIADLFAKERPIFSKDRTDASTYYAPTSSVKNSVVADGCIIEGTVENSIIFRNVKIGKGAVVKNCILMKDTEVGDNSIISYIIADKGSTMTPNTSLAASKLYPLILAKNSTI